MLDVMLEYLDRCRLALCVGRIILFQLRIDEDFTASAATGDGEITAVLLTNSPHLAWQVERWYAERAREDGEVSDGE